MDPRGVRTGPGWAALAALFIASGAALAACNADDPNALLSGSAASGGPTTGSGGDPSGAGGADGAGGAAGSGNEATTTSSSTSVAASTASSAAASGAGGAGGAGEGGAPGTVLDERVLSYTEALRSASFKLVGNAPSLQDVFYLRDAPDQAAAYAELIDKMMAGPEFARRMVEFWKSAFRMRGPASNGKPSRDTAPVFAARITVEGKPFTDLLTATSNTCPTFDEASGTFADGECNNGITPVGILTDPGVHALYFGNLAFRRTRFFHETFLCRRANEPIAEPGGVAGPGGPPGYASPWPWDSITGGPDAKVDFHLADGVVCANCHATWNHRAPLWANFDDKGQYQPTISVFVPAVGVPLAVRSDWLPDDEPTAWKFGVPTPDLPSLGAAMAADPEVHACAVARMWNYAMSRGDIVETNIKVSSEVIDPLVAQFQASNYSLRAILRTILLHDDFVRF